MKVNYNNTTNEVEKIDMATIAEVANELMDSLKLPAAIALELSKLINIKTPYEATRYVVLNGLVGLLKKVKANNIDNKTIVEAIDNYGLEYGCTIDNDNEVIDNKQIKNDIDDDNIDIDNDDIDDDIDDTDGVVDGTYDRDQQIEIYKSTIQIAERYNCPLDKARKIAKVVLGKDSRYVFGILDKKGLDDGYEALTNTSDLEETLNKLDIYLSLVGGKLGWIIKGDFVSVLSDGYLVIEQLTGTSLTKNDLRHMKNVIKKITCDITKPLGMCRDDEGVLCYNKFQKVNIPMKPVSDSSKKLLDEYFNDYLCDSEGWLRN